MADSLSQNQRSRLMSLIRSRDTGIERRVRQSLWHEGFRYRLHVRSLPGTPDLILSRYRIALMVHGCFWHGHDCPKGQKRPVANLEYWNRKLDPNIARDLAHLEQLTLSGWTVRTIWECQLDDGTEDLLRELRQLRDGKSAMADVYCLKHQ